MAILLKSANLVSFFMGLYALEFKASVLIKIKTTRDILSTPHPSVELWYLNVLSNCKSQTTTKSGEVQNIIPQHRAVGIQLVKPLYGLSFEVGGNLVVLCHDSGVKGCWFKSKAIHVSQKYLKVQYDEWITSYGIGECEKMGFRYTLHITVKTQPLEDYIEIEVVDDAWWSDGKVKLKMTVSIDINLAQSPSYHPPDHQTSSTTHTSRNSQNNPPEVGATCEVPVVKVPWPFQDHHNLECHRIELSDVTFVILTTYIEVQQDEFQPVICLKILFVTSGKFNFPYLVNTPRSQKRISALIDGLTSDEDSENITREDPSMQGPSGSRSVVASGHSSIGTIIAGNQIAKFKPPPTQAKNGLLPTELEDMKNWASDTHGTSQFRPNRWGIILSIL
uniref:Uncharacterized protein n=1 Tax=Solanum lycopersicum TaxID=4081 RepID=A0A3Q7G671_SOLLC